LAYLGDTEEAGGVTEFPVTELVRQDSEDLIWVALLEQGIVDDNVLLPWETVEVGVGVGAALAPVDDVELLEGELELGSELLHLGLELALLEGRELVEQRQDEDGVRGDHEQLQGGGKDPEVEDEAGARLLDDLEETGEDGRGERKGQKLRLEQVGEEELGRLLVEAKLLLEHKGMIDLDRHADELLDKHKAQHKHDGVQNLAAEPLGRPFQQQVARPGPQLGEHVELDEGDVDDLRPEAADDGEGGLGAAVGLGLVKGLRGDLLGEDGGRGGALQDAVLAEGEEGLEEVLANGEAEDELLPGKEGSVEGLGEALRGIHVNRGNSRVVGLGHELRFQGEARRSHEHKLG
jgi:hypothetical protein